VEVSGSLGRAGPAAHRTQPPWWSRVTCHHPRGAPRHPRDCRSVIGRGGRDNGTPTSSLAAANTRAAPPPNARLWPWPATREPVRPGRVPSGVAADPGLKRRLELFDGARHRRHVGRDQAAGIETLDELIVDAAPVGDVLLIRHPGQGILAGVLGRGGRKVIRAFGTGCAGNAALASARRGGVPQGQRGLRGGPSRV
jgi:hypothetical protein